MSPTQRTLAWLATAVALAAIPPLFGPYYTNLFLTFAIFSVFSVSLNLLLGYTGLFSFGHAMFFGTGAYATALALKHVGGLPLLAAVGIGVAAAALLALVLCPIVVRVSGTAFAMLHLAFSQMMYVLALKLHNITGGEDGIGNFPIPALTIPGVGPIPMKDEPANFYYFAIALLALSLWLMWFFTRTTIGHRTSASSAAAATPMPTAASSGRPLTCLRASAVAYAPVPKNIACPKLKRPVYPRRRFSETENTEKIANVRNKFV